MRTPVKHTYSTPAFHTTSEAHNVPHTTARISARTHQIHPGSWAGSTELASNRIRSATGSTLVATHERPTSGSSPKHATLACGPPPSRKTCLQDAFTSPRRAARQPAHPARDLCTFATADRTDVQTPRDLITAANVKRRAGGRRGSGSNLHRNGLSMCTSSQQAACRRGWSSSWRRCHSRHKGTAAGRQTACQAVALAATPHMDMGKGWGRSQARASEQEWHGMYLCGRQK